VHDRAQRSFVAADRPRQRHEGRLTTAARARRLGDADDPPGGERVTAGAAAGRGDRDDRIPAARAHWSARRFFERLVAGGARRSEQDGKRAIEGRSQRRP
jgi:hypothetical protein